MLRVEDEDIVVSGEQDVNEQWLREISNNSTVTTEETCTVHGFCERSSVMVVPRVVIESELSLDSVEMIGSVAQRLVLLKNKYAFDGFTIECPLSMWRPLVALLRSLHVLI